MQLPPGLAKKLFVPRIMISRGIVPPLRPDQLLKVLTIRKHFGSTAATGYAVAALRNPDSEAIVDEAGTLTFRQVHERTNALAHALSDHGILEGDRVAIMCRNHRGFIESAVACAKLGANIIYLNTAFAGPQLADVVRREQPVALIYDQEFTGLMAEASEGMRCFIGWVDDRDATDLPTLEDLIGKGDPADVVPPSEHGRVVILTSGTTGTPKGASRKAPDSALPAAVLLDAIPLPGARAHDDRRADVPLVGRAAPVAGDRPGLDGRAAPPLQARDDARGGRRAQVRRARRRARDAAADAGARAGDDQAVRHELAADHRRQRLGAPRRARHARDGHVRRRALQPLRLDRGRLGDDRHARRTCAACPAPPAECRSTPS